MQKLWEELSGGYALADLMAEKPERISTRIPFRCRGVSQPEVESMNVRQNILIRGYYKTTRSYVSFICPACECEVYPKEIIEKNGRVGCVNCLK